MIGTRDCPAASSALRMPATRPSIMSLGATMSTPAPACDPAPHAAAVTHEQGPHELRGNEVRFLHQPAQRGGATQPTHPANRERAHRASNLDAPCAASKPATATPAAAGSRASISADAVICTEPSGAVTLPNNRVPSPESRVPTYAATRA